MAMIRCIKALMRSYDRVAEIPFKLVRLRWWPFRVVSGLYRPTRARLLATIGFMLCKGISLLLTSINVDSQQNYGIFKLVVCRNYGVAHILGLVLMLVVWKAACKSTKRDKTLFSCVTRVVSSKRLNALTGLYSDAQRLTIWRRVMVTRYVTLVLSVLGVMCLVAFNVATTLAGYSVSDHPILVTFLLCVDILVALMSASFATHFTTHYPLQLHFYVYRMTSIREHLEKCSLIDHPVGTLNFIITIKTHLADWKQLKDEFDHESRGLSQSVTTCLFGGGQQAIVWLYFVANMSHDSDGLAPLFGGSFMAFVCISVIAGVGFTASQIDHQRHLWVKTLYKLGYHNLKKERKRTKVYLQQKLISEIERDAPHMSHWAVKCWPTTLTISYGGSVRILVELIILYMLLVQSIGIY